VVSCTAKIGTSDYPNQALLPSTTTGTYRVDFSATDGLGNTNTNHTIYTVTAAPGGLATQVPAGGTVSSGSDATPDVPVQTSITAPAAIGGLITVTPRDTTTSAPGGLSLFGKEVVLTGPVATAADPYTVRFTVDASSLNGVAPADVQVLRNGSALTGCTSPTAAVPDPCIVSRGFGAGGDAEVVVRTSQFSVWSLGRLSYALTGPFAPVAAAPVVNTAKAGASIPVKFKLGGNRGLDVLSGAPTSAVLTSCTATAKTAEVKQVSSAAASALTYDAASATYTYTWRTTTAMKGCRDLVLKFRDGTSLTTVYSLR
jgi:hypothetical protein